MKRWGGVAAGLAAIAVLSYLAFFWKKPEQIPRLRTETAVNSQVIDLDQAQAFELKNAKGTVRFRRNQDGMWLIEKPEKDIPDILFFGGLAEVLPQLTRKRIVIQAEKENLSQYGLNPPLATLTFEFKNQTEKKILRIGGVNPAYNALYAWYEDEPEIFLTEPKIRMFIVMGFQELRFRRLGGIQADLAREFKIVVKDPELRKKLLVPETRTVVKQSTSQGPEWLALDPSGSHNDGGQVEAILAWMGGAAIADKMQDLDPKELKQWGLDPPRAYFEITYSDHTEKVLVGNERDGLIYLMQEKRFKLLGFQKPPILEILGSDFRTHKLLLENDLVKMDQIEISFADGRDFKLVKQDQGFWAVGGDREKKFEARKTYWVTEPFVISDYLGYLTERPINFERYGLQPPRAKLRFYSGGQLFLEVWVGNWEAGKAKCYAYLPGPDQLIWFNFDLAGKIPPDPGVFLSKKE